MLNSSTRYLLAALQVIIGWEWIVSGFNKLLSGTFPQILADTLNDGLKDNPNTWYVAFIQSVVQPHSIFFGYLIEWTELLVGIVLLGGALLLILRPRVKGVAWHRPALLLTGLVAIAAVAATALCVNFHFWMGHGVVPGMAASPTDEGIDLDALMPPMLLLVLFTNLLYMQALRGKQFFPRLMERLRLAQEA